MGSSTLLAELSFRDAFDLVELFAWLVYALKYCVPIATLNQNKRSQLLYLGDAQITRMDTANNVVKGTECGLLKGFKAWAKVCLENMND